MRDEILTIGMIIIFLLLFVGFMTYLLMFNNNVNEIVGIKCARSSRINVDYPFCSTVLDCMEDCSIIQGGFVKAETVGGISNSDRCFCYTKNGIQNIW